MSGFLDYPKHRIDAYAAECGIPTQRPDESDEAYRLRVSFAMVSQGGDALEAVVIGFGEDALKEAPGLGLAAVHYAAHARAVQARAVGHLYARMPFREVEPVLSAHGFERLIRESFQSRQDSLNGLPSTYDLWGRASEGLLFALTSFRWGSGEETLSSGSLYAQVNVIGSGESSDSSFGTCNSPLFREYKVNPKHPEDDRFAIPMHDTYMGRYHVAHFEEALTFVADVRSHPEVCFAPTWHRAAHLYLGGLFGDHALLDEPRIRNLYGKRRPDLEALSLQADEAGVTLRDFQVGRRISLLPPEYRAILQDSREARQAVAAYEKGLAAGIREPGQPHPPPQFP